jgi:hypothetical protein
MPDDGHHQVQNREDHVDREGERRVDGVLRADPEPFAEHLEEEPARSPSTPTIARFLTVLMRSIRKSAASIRRIDASEITTAGAGPSNALDEQARGPP